MFLLGIRDQEIRTPRTMSRVTLSQSTNRDIPFLSVAIRILVFKRFRVQGRGRDVPNPTGDIGEYTSRDDIS